MRLVVAPVLRLVAQMYLPANQLTRHLFSTLVH